MNFLRLKQLAHSFTHPAKDDGNYNVEIALAALALLFLMMFLWFSLGSDTTKMKADVSSEQGQVQNNIPSDNISQ